MVCSGVISFQIRYTRHQGRESEEGGWNDDDADDDSDSDGMMMMT